MQSLASQMRSLTTRIQVNHLGLPDGIYRPDFLPALPSPPEVLAQTQLQLGVDANTTESDLNDLPLFSDITARTSHDVTLVQGDMFMDAEDGLDYCVAIESGGLEEPETVAPSVTQALTVINEAEELYQRQLAQYDKDLKAAYVMLDYSEGYPTLDGMPFWFQFPFEPSDAYALFEAYLSQYKTGARQLHQVLDAPLLNTLKVKPTISQLEELFHTYNWSLRAKAADMFFAAHRRKERERRAMDTEDAHYAVAARLMSLCDTYLAENGEELIETMTPKAFIEFLKTATTLQRISVGLNANGPGSDDKTPHGVSTEVIMRTIADKNAPGELATIDENGANIATKEDKLAKILQNPELTSMAQEIIIRMGHN